MNDHSAPSKVSRDIQCPLTSALVEVVRMCTSWWSSTLTPVVMWWRWRWRELMALPQNQGTRISQMLREEACPK